MKIISRDLIDVPARQRSEKRKGVGIGELKASILCKGLMHPPVVHSDGLGRYALVAGEGRLLAIASIAEDGGFFLCDGKPITSGEVPVTEVTDLSPHDLFEAEFEENEYREPLSWQDRAAALAKLHEIRLAENPKQTFRATAQELIDKSAGTLSGSNHAFRLGPAIRQSTIIAKHLDNPKVANARNATEALAAILKQESEGLEAELIRRQLLRQVDTSLVEIRHGNSLSILPSLEAEQFDLLLVDPPYG